MCNWEVHYDTWDTFEPLAKSVGETNQKLLNESVAKTEADQGGIKKFLIKSRVEEEPPAVTNPGPNLSFVIEWNTSRKKANDIVEVKENNPDTINNMIASLSFAR